MEDCNLDDNDNARKKKGTEPASIWGRASNQGSSNTGAMGSHIYARHSQETSKEDKVARAE